MKKMEAYENMGAFLTVEDINSILYKYGDVPTLHSIDTSKIGTNEFSNKMYDFCIVSHTINGANHTFTFTIQNSLWDGGYYFTNLKGDYLNIDGNYNDNTITVTTNDDSITLFLSLTNLYSEFEFKRLTWISEDLGNISCFYNAEDNQYFNIKMLDGSKPSGTVTFKFEGSTSTSPIEEDGKVKYNLKAGNTHFNGVVSVIFNGCTYYIRPKFIKNIIPIRIKENLTVSKINTVTLTIPQGFTGLKTGTVYFEGKKINIDFSKNTFELDLREKIKANPVKFDLEVDETSTVMNHRYTFNIPTEILKINSYTELKTELESTGGCRLLELGEDIKFSENILINHDAKIIGNGHIANLKNHSLKIKEGLSLKLEDITFSTGNPAIIQGLNTSLEATKCIFTNCRATQFNNLGSAIFCDIDLDSLKVSSDFTTILNECNFTDNHSAILHGGGLQVNKCLFVNADSSCVDKNNVAFLYQVDGEAVIKDSAFQIQYDDKYMWRHKENIGFGQALFKCGLEAQINTASHEYLSKDNSAIFCEPPYNNECNLSVNYYLPQEESCVTASAVIGKEGNALCHSISDDNIVFKDNVQIKRVECPENNKKE